MSDFDLHLKSAKIAGLITPTKNHMPLTITAQKHTYFQY